MKRIIMDDLYRFTGKKDKKSLIKTILKNKSFRCLYFYRKCNINSKFNFIYRIFYHLAYKNCGVELPLSAKIGSGVLFLHPFAITLNSQTVVGKNFTILKGATIGSTKNNKGESLVPTIGDNVYVGLNSTVVGDITIGNDVLIAANTFVNFDVPDHSIVIGSPGVIHSKKEATKNYINNPIE